MKRYRRASRAFNILPGISDQNRNWNHNVFALTSKKRNRRYFSLTLSLFSLKDLLFEIMCWRMTANTFNLYVKAILSLKHWTLNIEHVCDHQYIAHRTLHIVQIVVVDWIKWFWVLKWWLDGRISTENCEPHDISYVRKYAGNNQTKFRFPYFVHWTNSCPMCMREKGTNGDLQYDIVRT